MKPENVDTKDLNKTDKETQSPVHKVFQDIIAIEQSQRNPEKARLLDKKENIMCQNLKAKSYVSGVPEKEMVQELIEKKKFSHIPSRKSSKMTNHQSARRAPDIQDYCMKHQNVTIPITKESWSMWKNEKESSQEKSTATSDINSCRLKRILNSGHCGVACLIILFTLSVIATIVLVCKPQMKQNLVNSNCDNYKIKGIFDDDENLPDSVKFKRRLEGLINGGNKDYRLNSNEDIDTRNFGYNKKYWDDPDSKDLADLLSYEDTRNVQDLKKTKYGIRYARGFIDAPKIDTENLKNFYQKFIEAEAQMKNIKKQINDNDREKRSLKHRHEIKNRRFKKGAFNNHNNNNSEHKILYRDRRNLNDSRANGFFLENKKFNVFLGVPQMLNNINSSYSSEGNKYNLGNFIKLPTHKSINLDQINNNSTDEISTKIFKRSSSREFKTNEEDFYFDDYKNMKNKIYDSTNLDIKHKLVTEPLKKPNSARVLSSRKLLQAENDDADYPNYENVEDEGGETEDDIYKTDIKREAPTESNSNIEKSEEEPRGISSNELNSIIKNAALQNIFNNIHMPNKSMPENDEKKKNDIGKRESNIDDLVYVEDYLQQTQRNEKSAKFAQAYSDYGVFNEKKESTEKNFDENRKPVNDLNRIKLSFESNRNMFKKVPLFENSETKIESAIENNELNLEVESPTTTTATVTKKKDIMKYFEKFFKEVPNSEKNTFDKLHLNVQEVDKNLNTPKRNEANELKQNSNIKSRFILSVRDEMETEEKKSDKKYTPTTNLTEGKKYKKEASIIDSITFYLWNIFKPWLQMPENFQNKKINVTNSNILKPRALLSSNNSNSDELSFKYNVSDILISNNTKNTNNVSDVTNKTLVKRDINENNLIFWNDIYDEEYGVKDPLDDYEHKRDLTSNKKGVMRKSEIWFKRKVKKLKHKLHRQENKIGNKKEEIKQKIKNEFKHHNENKIPQYEAYKMFRLRRSNEQKVSKASIPNFEALHANMKNVFKKAVEAVNSAKKLEVRESETKNNAVATSLMQQLVNLMTDLVDYQVQQKTCRKLPPDLQEFLLWLTAPDMESNSVPTYVVTEPEDFVTKFDVQNVNDDYKDKSAEMLDFLSTSTGEKEPQPDMKTDCLGTLKSFENLLQDYNNMNEEDKKKVSVVKEFLERQKEYLQRYLSKYDSMDFAYTDNINKFYRYKRNSNRAKKIIKF